MLASDAANAGAAGVGVGALIFACGSTALADEDDVPLVFNEAPRELGAEYPVGSIS